LSRRGKNSSAMGVGQWINCHPPKILLKILKHIRRGVYQTGIWATSTLSQQVIPSPRDYGWAKEPGSCEPIWMTLPEVPTA